MSAGIPFVDAGEVARLLDYRVLLPRLRAAFLSPPVAPERMVVPLGAEDARLLVMPAARPGGLAGVKLVSVHPALADRPGGAVRALCVAIDAATGEPRAIIDGDALTHRRTAAASLLAAGVLARRAAATVLIVGTGQVARALCECHAEILSPERLLVWGRRPEAAEAFAAELQAGGIAVQPVADLSAAVAEADIVSAATLSRQPLIRGADVRAGTHVDLVGGFTPAMREADDRLVAAASLFADTASAIDTAGDLAQPVARGIVDRGHIGLLGEVLSGACPGRTDAAQITLFKSVGHALEDLAAMELIAEGLAR